MSETFFCFMCGKEVSKKDNNESEHIFPYSIGGNLTITEVCSKCNREILGDNLDTHLVNHFFIQIRRLMLNIRGKKGDLPNPFFYGEMADDPSQKVYFHIEPGKDSKIVNVKKKKEIINEDGVVTGVEILVDKSQENEAEEIINKILERYKKKGLNFTTTEGYKNSVKIEKPQLKYSVDIDIINYHKSILKIAYEIAYLEFGISFTENSEAKKIKAAFLSNPLDINYQENIGLQASIGFNEELFKFPFSPEKHYAMIINTGDQMLVYIRIFDIFEGSIVVATTPLESKDKELFPLYEFNPINRSHRKINIIKFLKEN